MDKNDLIISTPTKATMYTLVNFVQKTTTSHLAIKFAGKNRTSMAWSCSKEIAESRAFFRAEFQRFSHDHPFSTIHCKNEC